MGNVTYVCSGLSSGTEIRNSNNLLPRVRVHTQHIKSVVAHRNTQTHTQTHTIKTQTDLGFEQVMQMCDVCTCMMET